MFIVKVLNYYAKNTISQNIQKFQKDIKWNLLKNIFKKDTYMIIFFT